MSATAGASDAGQLVEHGGLVGKGLHRGAVGAHALDGAPARLRGGFEALQQRALRLQDVVGRAGFIREHVFSFQNPQGDFEGFPLKYFQILSAQKVRNAISKGLESFSMDVLSEFC